MMKETADFNALFGDLLRLSHGEPRTRVETAEFV
jgi:hypothetical protein